MISRHLQWLLIGCLVWMPAITFAQTTNPLDEIIAQVKTGFRQQSRPTVIFDLDGTILDIRPRVLKIVHEYAREEVQKVRPKLGEKLLTMQQADIQYAIADTLRNGGIEEDALITNGSIFWAERFFSTPYLLEDAPNEGVLDFVRKLYASGARIVYLTGRDQPRQLEGTIRVLQKYGFPVGLQGTELIMKPTSTMPDAIFKQRITSYLRSTGKVIAAFDNEPANVNVYRRAFGSETFSVLFETLHSPNPPPLIEGVFRLSSFKAPTLTKSSPKLSFDSLNINTGEAEPKPAASALDVSKVTPEPKPNPAVTPTSEPTTDAPAAESGSTEAKVQPTAQEQEDEEEAPSSDDEDEGAEPAPETGDPTDIDAEEDPETVLD
mgnify:CR=1 FL=1